MLIRTTKKLSLTCQAEPKQAPECMMILGTYICSLMLSLFNFSYPSRTASFNQPYSTILIGRRYGETEELRAMRNYFTSASRSGGKTILMIGTSCRASSLLRNRSLISSSSFASGLVPPYYYSSSSNSNSERPSTGNGNQKSSVKPLPLRMMPRRQPPKPIIRYRGPPSSEQTQTDFAALNVLGGMPAPTAAVDACLDDGFHLDNGMKITDGDGVLLVGGEAFAWRPWNGDAYTGTLASGGPGAGTKDRERSMGMINERGQFEVAEQVWGLFRVVWPRPGRPYPSPFAYCLFDI